VDTVADYAIFVLDPDEIVSSWNPGSERLKGYREEEIIGKNFRVFYTPEDVAIDMPGNELRIATRDGRYEEEGWRVRKEGTRFWANVLITRLQDANGQIIGFGKITRDLTERGEAELRYRLLIDGVIDYAIFS
jgi:PAS domain S-box-containing protein